MALPRSFLKKKKNPQIWLVSTEHAQTAQADAVLLGRRRGWSRRRLAADLGLTARSVRRPRVAVLTFQHVAQLAGVTFWHLPRARPNRVYSSVGPREPFIAAQGDVLRSQAV